MAVKCDDGSFRNETLEKEGRLWVKCKDNPEYNGWLDWFVHNEDASDAPNVEVSIRAGMGLRTKDHVTVHSSEIGAKVNVGNAMFDGLCSNDPEQEQALVDMLSEQHPMIGVNLVAYRHWPNVQ